MGNAGVSPDDPSYCNDTRLDCFEQKDTVIENAVSGGKATEYEVDFRVPHPGFYGVSVGMHDGEGSEAHTTESVQLLVGPGQPNLEQSSFQMLTNRHNAKEGNLLRFEVQVVDSDGDPRFGLDEVVVELTRLLRSDPTLGSNDRLLQPTAALTMLLMTKHSKQHATDEEAAGGIDLIPTGSRNGRYVVSKTFPTEHAGSKGVFRMRAWVCAPGNGTACSRSDENEIAHPNVPGSDGHKTLRFTVCPRNALISEDTKDVNSLESALAECKCDPGYSGPDGTACVACAPGEFKKEPGAASCLQCTAGTHCSCEVDQFALATVQSKSCTKPCKECVACAAGYYQHRYGQPDCAACPTVATGVGFLCPLDGMTWPLALPGYWVSGNDPTVFHDCAARPDACPGSPFAANASKLNVLRLAGTDASKETLQASCFRRSATNDDVLLSGWMSLPHDGLQQRWLSGQTVAPDSAALGHPLECWDIVGASCATGYSGAQHNKACVDCDTNWYPDSSTNTCAHCPTDSAFWLGFGVVVGSLILAPITIRFAGMAKHAGALTAPLMSLVNFLQSIDLFRQLKLQWPAQIKEFVLRVASLFNLNINILGIHPECSLHLNFWQKWCLKMMSPVGVIVSLAAAIFIRRWFARRVRNLAVVKSTALRKKSDLAMSVRGTARGDELHLVGGSWVDDADDDQDQVDDIQLPPRDGVSRAASPDLTTSLLDAEAGGSDEYTEGGLLDDLTTTENSLSRGSSRQAMRVSAHDATKSTERFSNCARFGLTLLGLILGTILGWMFLPHPSWAAGTAAIGAAAAYYFSGKKAKAHANHDVSSGERGGLERSAHRDATTVSVRRPAVCGSERKQRQATVDRL